MLFVNKKNNSWYSIVVYPVHIEKHYAILLCRLLINKLHMNTLIKQLMNIALLIMVGQLVAQQNYKLLPEGSSITINGTSSVHDWEMKMEDFRCSATFEMGNPSMKIKEVNFIGKATSIESSYTIMDDKTYDALNVEKFPDIRFTNANEEKVFVNNQNFSASIIGKLFLAGEGKLVSIPVSGKFLQDNNLLIIGSKTLKMSDFKVKPPTAMLGALKTGDEVTISFVFLLTRV